MTSIFSVDVALYVHTFTQLEIILPLCVVGTFFLYRKGYTESAYIFISAVILTEAIVGVMKLLFRVTRPDTATITLTTYAFPSGHAAMSFALATLGSWLLYKHTRLSKLSVSLFSILFLLIASYVTYTRIILGVHTWLQVSVGALVGILVPLLVIKFLPSILKKKMEM